jgi:hypothetical protein
MAEIRALLSSERQKKRRPVEEDKPNNLKEKMPRLLPVWEVCVQQVEQIRFFLTSKQATSSVFLQESPSRIHARIGSICSKMAQYLEQLRDLTVKGQSKEGRFPDHEEVVALGNDLHQLLKNHLTERCRLSELLQAVLDGITERATDLADGPAK